MAQNRKGWLALVVASLSIAIVSLDTTVLNVSIPTILREFDTTLPSLQWVITGYALTVASLLIIGGRLGDIYGHRRVFIIGASFFGVGSLIAALSQGVPELIIGEAVIEGIGASLMLPSTLAIISTTFEGRDRIKAFGVWGAVGGASAALGPVVGGLLTTNASWRWCFGLNVIVVPITIVGAMVFMPKSVRPAQRPRLDVRGAILIAVGMFLLVFALSEGPRYGWIRPQQDFTIAGVVVWPSTMPVSIVIVALGASAIALTFFVRLEMRRERLDQAPLFEFSQLRRTGFRIGLATTLAVSIGQLGLAFTLPIFLQEGRQLSAQMNGLWQLPTGVAFIIGSQLGSRLTVRFGPVRVVRVGIAIAATAFAYIAAVLTRNLTFLTLLPGLMGYGIGMAFAFTQLTNIVLSDVDRAKAGAAGGANNTAKQVGMSIGVAFIGSLLSARLATTAVANISASRSLDPATKASALESVRNSGVDFHIPPGATAAEASTLHRLFVDSLSSAGRVPLLFSCGMLVIGLVISSRLPKHQNVDAGIPLEALVEAEMAV